ncbi:MAG: hypothetical protein ACYCW6_05680 [Candidatus Xenobia bacterium]
MHHLLILLPAAFVLVGALAACGLLAGSLWPERVARCGEGLERHALRCGLSGLLLVLVEVWLFTLLGAPVAVAAVAVDLVLLAQGFPAVAARTGLHLGLSEARAVVAGTYLISFAGVLPVLGWFVAGYSVLQALGAAVQR